MKTEEDMICMYYLDLQMQSIGFEISSIRRDATNLMYLSN